jgi:hypothetical protein
LAATAACLWLKTNDLFNQGSRMHACDIANLAERGLDPDQLWASRLTQRF